MQHRAAARRLGQGPADLPRRPQGHGRPRRVGQGAERARQERALAHRRLGRPGAVDEDAPDLRRRAGDFTARAAPLRRAATSTSASASTRWARCLNGMALSKVRPYGSGFLIFSDYCASGDPARGDHGDSRHLHLHPRLDRRRRGRPDAPADRAARLAAGDPGPDHACGPATPTRSPRRGGYIMKLRHEPVVLDPRRGRRCRRSTARSTRRRAAWRKGAYVLADADGGKPDVHPAGHRQRGRRSASRPTSS